MADQLKFLFLDADDKSVFIIPALDARSQIFSIKDRRNGIGEPVLNLAPLGSGQTFTLVAPDLSVPGINNVRLFEKFCPQSYLNSFQKEMMQAPSLSLHSTQVLCFKDRRNGIGKPVFKLAPCGSAQLSTLVALDLCVPGIPEGVLQRVISHASTANV